MQSEIGQLIYRILGDNSGIKKSLKEVDSSISGTVSGVKKLGVMIAAVFAGSAIVDFYKKTIKYASDAEEENQKFGVVFSQIPEKANQMAASIASAYGLSTTEAKRFISTNGNVFESLGLSQEAALGLSTEVVKLGVDLASFTNYAGGTSGAIEAISKALIGERESLKSLGIAVLDEDLKNFANTLGKNYEALTKQEKATLSLQYITKLSANAVGDFGRSSDSWANVQRRLSASIDETGMTIGKILLPALSQLGVAFINSSKDGGVILDTVKSVTSGLAQLIRTVALAISAFDLWTAQNQLNSKADYVGIQNEKYKALNKEIKDFSTSTGSSTQYTKEQLKAMSATSKKAAELVAKYQLINAGNKALEKGYEGAEDKVRKLTDATDKIVKSMTEENEIISDNIQKKELARQKESLTDAQIKQNYDRKKALLEASIIQETAAGNKINLIKLNAQKSIDEIDNNRLLSVSEKSNAEMAIIKKAEDEIFAYKVSKVNEYGTIAAGMANGLMSALSAYSAQQTKNEIYEIDAREQRALEAAGLAEDTALQKAQKEYDLLTDLQKADVNNEKVRALEKAKIMAKYDKERKKAEYEGALTAWDIQVAMSSVTAAQSILNAFAAGWNFGGPIGAAAFTAIATATSAIMMATIIDSKPKPPKFATGGIVPGNSLSGDSVAISANSREMVLTQEQQAQLFDMANGNQSSNFVKVPSMSKEDWLDLIFRASQDGRLFLDKRALV